MDAPLGQSAPDSGTSGNEFDFQRGYNELRPEYTRVTQELSTTQGRLSEYEQLFEALHDSDPEVQAAAMEALGLELDTGSQQQNESGSSEEFVDPLEQEVRELRGALDELRGSRELEAQQAEAARLIEMRDEYIGEAIGFIEKSLKFQLTESEEEVLGNLAIAMEKDGVPDVQGAYQRLYGDVLETNRERWIASKTGAYAAPAGTSIPAEQRPKSKSERISYIDERVRALDAQR